MVKVVDNLLSPEELKKLNDVLMGPEFPWYFLPDKVKSGDGNFQFAIILYYQARLCLNL